MKHILNFFNSIYWFFYKLTPAGKRAYVLSQGFKGIMESNTKNNITKLGVIGTAKKLLKPQKLVAFHKGKSITKSKKTNHQVLHASSKIHKDELTERGLKITRKGNFKHA